MRAELRALRETPAYRDGNPSAIAQAARLALETGGVYGGPLTRRVAELGETDIAGIDYAAIDAQYAQDLTDTGAPGWTDKPQPEPTFAPPNNFQ